MMGDGGNFGLGIWSEGVGREVLEEGGGIGMVGGLWLLVEGLINDFCWGDEGAPSGSHVGTLQGLYGS